MILAGPVAGYGPKYPGFGLPRFGKRINVCPSDHIIILEYVMTLVLKVRTGGIIRKSYKRRLLNHCHVLNFLAMV